MNSARILVLVLLAGVMAAAQTPAPRAVAIVDTTVIPMVTNGAVLANHTVILRGPTIASVGPAMTASVPDGALRIDGRGKFVIPGLADMHVHLEYFDDPKILALFTTNGVTTVRNMDGRPYILDWRRKIAGGELPGPRIYTAGPLLDGNPPVRPDNTVVATAAGAGAAVDQQAAAGYDFIKVYSALSREAYDSILAAARAKQLAVVGHVPRAVGLDAAIAGGQAAIEHLADYATPIEADDSPFKGKGHWSKRYLSAPIDPARLRALADRMAKAGVWSVPTLIQPLRELLRPNELAAQLESAEVRQIPPDGREQWREMVSRVAARMDDEDWKLVAAGAARRPQVVAAFRAAGVPLLIGTDTPNPFVVPGYAVHDELALAVEAGLSPAEAIAASTREAARFMKSTAWGTIEAGKAADLVVLDANPLADIANTRKIHAVFVGGRQVDRTPR